MSVSYDNKYMSNRAVHRIEKQRLQVKRQVSAHQKAPLDYISPWQSHHQQMYLLQAQNNQSIQTKPGDQKYSVVNAFLQKIRKSSKNHKKNKNILGRNMTVGQEMINAHSRMGQHNRQQRLQSGKRKKFSQSMTKNYTQSTGFQNQQFDGQLKKHLQIKGVNDVGFGLLEYSKVSGRQIGFQRKQQNNLLRKSVTSYNSRNSFPSNAYYTHYNKMNQIKNLDGRNFLDITQVNLSTKNVNINRLFTEEERKRPTQVVFIKKKKCSNKAAVIDINSTAQQFYQDQIRTAQNQMVHKYRKLAPKKQILASVNNKRRCGTQQSGGNINQMRNTSVGHHWDNRSRYRKSQKSAGSCYDNTQILLDQELIKKKYSFLQQLKDQTLVVRIQNMMRQHPSLAQSLLISK